MDQIFSNLIISCCHLLNYSFFQGREVRPTPQSRLLKMILIISDWGFPISFSRIAGLTRLRDNIFEVGRSIQQATSAEWGIHSLNATEHRSYLHLVRRQRIQLRQQTNTNTHRKYIYVYIQIIA